VSAERENVTNYFQLFHPVSLKKPVAADCRPARTHDVHSKDAPGNKICPALIGLFDHEHFDGLAAG
jgi:hypothetical protein